MNPDPYTMESMLKNRIIIPALLGNILEFYDFSLFGAMAVLLGKLFFPDTTPYGEVLYAFSAFSAGFLARPLGALLFGYIGDRYGRKQALSLSLILMAIPTLGITLLPPYAQIGLLAPIALTLFRFIQGLCAGAEYNGAAIFLIEHSGNKNSGLAGSLVALAGTLGCLMAMAVSGICMNPALPEWCWRVAYGIGFSLAFVGYFIRKYVDESPAFLQAKGQKSNPPAPAKVLFREFQPQLLTGFFISTLGGTTAGMLVAFFPAFLSTAQDFSADSSLFLTGVGISTFVLTVPFWGILSDRRGHATIMSFAAMGLVIGGPLVFFLFSTGIPLYIILGQVIFGIFAAGFAGPLNAYMTQLFPPMVRFTGVSLSYGTAMAVTGGLTPLLMVYLIKTTGMTALPGFYVSFIAAVAVFFLKRPLGQKIVAS